MHVAFAFGQDIYIYIVKSATSMLRAPLMKYDWSLHVELLDKTWDKKFKNKEEKCT